MKNRFLKTTSWIMGIIGFVALFFLNAPTPVPFMVLCVAFAWLVFFWWANDWFPEK